MLLLLLLFLCFFFVLFFCCFFLFLSFVFCFLLLFFLIFLIFFFGGGRHLLPFPTPFFTYRALCSIIFFYIQIPIYYCVNPFKCLPIRHFRSFSSEPVLSSRTEAYNSTKLVEL